MTATFFGFNPPFIGGVQNVMSRQEDIRLIKNDLLQLLLTIPGERVMRPNFGVNLRNFVFEQLVSSDLSLLEADIISEVNRQEPRVIVDLVHIREIPDSNKISVSVQARLKRDPTRDVSVELFLENSSV